MKLRYDPSVDALSIDLFDEPVEDSEEIDEGVILDYDKSGRAIGVEILNFMSRLKEANAPPDPIILERMPPVLNEVLGVARNPAATASTQKNT